MTAAVVLWPALLGVAFLIAGAIGYRADTRSDLRVDTPRPAFGLETFGPAFVAGALAAFAGEHFSAGPILAQLVPKWMPGRLFMAYFVGVAHLAAALSIVLRRYVRWSSIGLAAMFALFVLLMDLPGALARPEARFGWSLAMRQATFALGALALFITESDTMNPTAAKRMLTIIRVCTACVLVFYGIEHFLRPDFAPGVPSPTQTAPWVPFPAVIAYATGVLLIVCGAAMFIERYAAVAAPRAGLLMTILTAALYVPQFFIATTDGGRVTAINFIFDTLLFAGMLFIIGHAVSAAAVLRASTISPMPTARNARLSASAP